MAAAADTIHMKTNLKTLYETSHPHLNPLRK